MDAIGSSLLLDQTAPHCRDPVTSDLSLLWACQSMGAITSQVIKMRADYINCLQTSEVW